MKRKLTSEIFIKNYKRFYLALRAISLFQARLKTEDVTALSHDCVILLQTAGATLQSTAQCSSTVGSNVPECVQKFSSLTSDRNLNNTTKNKCRHEKGQNWLQDGPKVAVKKTKRKL